MSDLEPTEVDTASRPGKRERLVLAATDLVHRQGVEATTLAEIAEAADVPLGNIYYYFKTKDAIIDAVVEGHLQGIGATIALVGRQPTPKRRLKALIGTMSGHRDLIAKFGCPDGTLLSELEKQRNDHAAKQLIAVPLAWVEEQFRSMGRRDAHALAIEFLVRYQGTAVLTHALGDPSLLADEGKRLERWIDSLDPN